MTENELRKVLLESLQKQGFFLDGDRLRFKGAQSKAAIRALHRSAVEHRRKRAKKYLKPLEKRLLRYIASGPELDPSKIVPRLVKVRRGSEEELLFRWCSLHWSIPVSSGYGRRLRFLVFDEYNDKLIGLIGLGDPVFSLRCRDDWVGWNQDNRARRLRHVMDAFVLGAVPPYNMLLGGKLVAMLAASDEVRSAIRKKYKGRPSRILGTPFDGNLVMLTTASALGRSSIYNRLRYNGRLLYKPAGFTQGSGEFHFSNNVYAEMVSFVTRNSTPSAKNPSWGNGFRNRREVVRKCLALLNLPENFIYHGVRRQVFVIPLAENTKRFLTGRDKEPVPLHRPADRLAEYFTHRWLLPRACWDKRYLEYNRDRYRLWD